MSNPGTHCPNCGATISEDPADPVLVCEYCGTEFSTPEHDERHRHYMEHEYMREQLEEQRRHNDLAESEERRSWFKTAVLAIGGFFAGVLGRILQFAFGVVLVIASVPLVMQYGFLQSLVNAGAPPKVIQQETFEERILKNLEDEAAQTFLLKNYVRNVRQKVYTLRNNLSYRQKEAVRRKLNKSGYSISDMYKFFFSLPVLGGMYASFAASAEMLVNQIIAALFLASGLALVKRKR